MNRTQKVKLAEEMTEKFNKADGIFVTDFRGLTVEKMTLLRFELKKATTDLKVVKNRVALRALDGGKAKESAELKKSFDYMTAVALSYGDPAAAAKALTGFAKTNEEIKVRGAFIDGKLYNLAQIKALATLPSKPELLAKLLGTWVAVPSAFVRVLNGVPAKWVYLLEALRKQKSEKEA